jgi:hypothetical protein
MLFSREEEAVSFDIRTEVVEIAFDAGHGDAGLQTKWSDLRGLC